MLYRTAIRPLLFAAYKDPESAHERALDLMERLALVGPALALVSKLFGIKDARLEQKVGNLVFPNPIGIGAGFDKNARVVETLQALGFGSVTTGTFTPKPQNGHDRTRIWRDVESEAIYNRMGFPNDGAAIGALRLRAMRNMNRVKIPIGASIGKQSKTPLKEAYRDYEECVELLTGLVDYFEINVSSPNTEGLRDLQSAAHLDHILERTFQAVHLRAQYLGVTAPDVLLKIAPDLEEGFIHEVVRLCLDHGVTAVVATNTTSSRNPGDPDHPGGKSGTPLFPLALEKVRQCHEASEGKLPVIGVGGISTVDHALQMFDAGASLLQVYTGFIYKGPRLARTLNRGFVTAMNADPFGHVSDLMTARSPN